jgi:ribosome maturation factor RimP
MGARRPFFVKGPAKTGCEQGESNVLAATHDKEKALTRDIARRVETALPATEVLAVELTKPDGFTVFIDDVRGVDHALCVRVTELLSDYRRDWDISVSSPGTERPLRTPQHFRNVVGRRVALRTETKRRLRGQVVGADDSAVTVRTQTESLAIPYGEIVRGNLIEEG